MLTYTCVHGSKEKLAKYVISIVKLSCPSKYVNVQAFWSLSGHDVQTPPKSYCELCVYVHTYVCTYMICMEILCTYVHTYVRMYIHTYTLADMHISYVRMYCMWMLVYIGMYTYAYIRSIVEINTFITTH